MNIKRILMIAISISALTLLICACGKDADDGFSNDSPTGPETQSEIAEAVFGAVNFTDELIEISESVARTLYLPDTQEGDYEINAYCGTGALAEELVIVKIKIEDRSDALTYLNETFAAYRDKQIGIFENYNIAESLKLQDAVMVSLGDFFVYCVSPHAPAVSESINDLTK